MNFTDHLKTKTSDIERPAVMPIGVYVAVVSKAPVITEHAFTDKNGNDYDTVDFFLKPIAVAEGVDTDELQKFGGVAAALPMRHRFMFNLGQNEEAEANQKRTLFALKQFLEKSLRIPEGLTLADAINQAVNKQCLVAVGHRDDDRPGNAGVTYAEIKRTAPIA